MPSLTDLARRHTSLTRADLECLHALVSDWQLLADLSFADLILWAPLRDGSGWMALAQMRPTTGPTSFMDDVVGDLATPEDKPLLDTARDERRIWRESDPDWTTGVPVRAETIPVTREGRVIAVIERNTNLNSARTPSRLELTYLQGADDLARMVASLVISSRSRRRSSVTSRTRISAPVRSPPTMSGMARSWTTEPLPSISASRGARPQATSISDSSTGSPGLHSLAVSGPSSAPTRSVARPSRRNADSALGLA